MTAPDLPTWRKSRRSGGEGGNCVEVALIGTSSGAVRDSKNPNGPMLRVTRPGMMAAFAAIAAGHLDH